MLSHIQKDRLKTFYFTAKTNVEDVNRSSALHWQSLSYIRGSIAAVSLHVSWVNRGLDVRGVFPNKPECLYIFVIGSYEKNFNKIKVKEVKCRLFFFRFFFIQIS